ncbi:MAG: hypothetical protein ABW292_19045, partial [Vicinamibacterales bacterium]
MRKLLSFLIGAVAVFVTVAIAGGLVSTQQAPVAAPPASPDLADDSLLRWPLPAGAEKFAAIDGKRMHRDVVAQAMISRRYRDAGHPKFWGRIIGTSSDTESAEWLAARFRDAGLSEVRIQPFDLAPQWMPQSWEVSVTSGGKTLKMESAQPNYSSVATPPAGLDLEGVYVGLGSEADYVGKDVRGKAVFVFTQVGLQLGQDWTALAKRADAKGAAAYIEVDMLPGNM